MLYNTKLLSCLRQHMSPKIYQDTVVNLLLPIMVVVTRCLLFFSWSGGGFYETKALDSRLYVVLICENICIQVCCSVPGVDGPCAAQTHKAIKV